MKTILLRGDFGTYELALVSKRATEKFKKETGNETILFQTDFDFPGLARSLGWNGKIKKEKCSHSSTDGTVDCKNCNKKTTDFISAAQEWLDKNINRIFVGKGEEYFLY